MDLKLPEETLMKLGFKTLDLMYGELTIKKGIYYDEVFVDKNGVGRLGYKNLGLKKQSFLGYPYKDRDFFLSIIPVEVVDYRRVLKAWILERYKRRVDTTVNGSEEVHLQMLERYKRKVDTTI